jgi:shikimate kinase
VSALVLIGPPAAGKTTVGRELAGLLRVEFMDTDEMVAERAGRPIGEIFTRDGEAAFRAMERTAVLDALGEAQERPLVVAVGGGAPMDPVVAADLADRPAAVVFLDISAALAARRVGLGATRPLLSDSPRKIWRELMARRRPRYEELATARVEVDGKPATVVAEEIARLVMAKET